MNDLINAFKHTICGVPNIFKILLGSGNIVDEKMKKSIVEGTYRLPQTVDKDLCLGCGVCARICPNECIEIKHLEEKIKISENRYKESYPELNVGQCCYCYQCHDNCPTFSLYHHDAAINPRGIRETGVTAQILLKKDNAEKEAEAKLMTVDEDLCLGCGVCAEVCPVKCITMVDLDEPITLPNGQVKTKVPKIDVYKCVKCMMCHNSCLTKKVHGKEAAINPNGLTKSGLKAADLFKKEGENV